MSHEFSSAKPHVQNIEKMDLLEMCSSGHRVGKEGTMNQKASGVFIKTELHTSVTQCLAHQCI